MTTAGVPVPEWAWQRQSVWSQTADALKKRSAQRQAWLLGVTVAAAVLALAGSQAKGASLGASIGLGLVAAAALAAVSILRGLTKKEQVRQWTRARSVSEALKSEVFLFLSGAGDYQADDRGSRLEATVNRLQQQAGDLARYTSRETPRKRALPEVSNTGTYLEKRVRESQLQGYYEPKARLMEDRLGQLKAAEVTLAGVAAVLAATAGFWPSVAAWAAVVTTAGGAVAAYVAAQRYEYQWIEYSRTASELRRLLERRTGADGRALSDTELVEHCEQVISVQNEAWMAKWGEEVNDG